MKMIKGANCLLRQFASPITTYFSKWNCMEMFSYSINSKSLNKKYKEKILNQFCKFTKSQSYLQEIWTNLD